MTFSLRKVLAVTGAVLLMGAGGSNLLKADTIAYTTSGTESDLGAYGLSGIEFTLSQNIDLTQLGYTGLSLGGGDAPHVTVFQVGTGLSDLTQLYDTGNIIGSVTSTGQSTSTGAPSFVAVTGGPLTLTAGNTYLITAPSYWAATFTSAGVTPLDGAVFGSTSFLTTGPGNWSGWPNPGYTFTSLSAASPANVPTVANFQYNVAAVPEPSTYVMLGVGFAILLFGLRRRSA